MKKISIIALIIALIFTLAGCASDTGVPDIKTATKNLEAAGYTVNYTDYSANPEINGEAITAESRNDYIIIVWYKNSSFKEKAADFCAKTYPSASCVSNRTGVYYCSTPSAMQAAGITPIKIG